MEFQAVYERIQSNIKFCRARRDYSWDDIRNIIKNNKYDIKLSYIKKLSYGQVKTVDLEKLMIIAQIFGENWITFTRKTYSHTKLIVRGKEWLNF